MKKAELVAAIAEKTELSKKDAEKAVKAFTEVVEEELKRGGESTFGTRHTLHGQGHILDRQYRPLWTWI